MLRPEKQLFLYPEATSRFQQSSADPPEGRNYQNRADPVPDYRGRTLCFCMKRRRCHHYDKDLSKQYQRYTDREESLSGFMMKYVHAEKRTDAAACGSDRK